MEFRYKSWGTRSSGNAGHPIDAIVGVAKIPPSHGHNSTLKI